MTRGEEGAVLAVDGLRFGYPGCELFFDWSSRVPAGVTLVRGGEGRGKTTLLRLLAGDLQPQAGAMRIAGVDFAGQRAAYRRQVFWTDPRTPAHDGISMVEYLAAQRALWPRFDAALLDRLIDGLALAPHAGKPLYMLSTGSKRKVWLAAAFAAGALVTLIDDPFGALDRASVAFVERVLAEFADDPERAWVVAGYEAPRAVPLAAVVDLGD